MTVVGTKYTTARAVAERVVDALVTALDRPAERCRTGVTPLPGGDMSDTDALIGGSGRAQSRGKAPVPGMRSTSDVGKHAAELAGMPAADLADLIQQLTDQMHTAAGELQFELAARLRDEVAELKKELRGMHEAGVAR